MPEKLDKWLPLLQRNSKRLHFGSEIHVQLKAYLPAAAFESDDSSVKRMAATTMAAAAAATKTKTGKHTTKKKKPLPTNIKSLRPKYKSHHKKFQRIRDLNIQKENVRLQKRIDALKTHSRNSGGGDASRTKRCYEVVPESLKTKGEKINDVRRKEELKKNKENEINVLLNVDFPDGKSTYLDYVKLQKRVEILAKIVSDKKKSVEILRTKVARVEGKRR